MRERIIVLLITEGPRRYRQMGHAPFFSLWNIFGTKEQVGGRKSSEKISHLRCERALFHSLPLSFPLHWLLQRLYRRSGVYGRHNWGESVLKDAPTRANGFSRVDATHLRETSSTSHTSRIESRRCVSMRPSAENRTRIRASTRPNLRSDTAYRKREKKIEIHNSTEIKHNDQHVSFFSFFFLLIITKWNWILFNHCNEIVVIQEYVVQCAECSSKSSTWREGSCYVYQKIISREHRAGCNDNTTSIVPTGSGGHHAESTLYAQRNVARGRYRKNRKKIIIKAKTTFDTESTLLFGKHIKTPQRTQRQFNCVSYREI